MKVLVPSDFSKVSNNAALYAAKFAKKINAELILLHVVHFEVPPMIQVTGFVEKEIEEARISHAHEECDLLIKELSSKVKGVQISSEVIPGYPIDDVIKNYASANKIDLIIMGTKGAKELEKLLFGSNTIAVINSSSVPVITVPEYARFNQLKHIVFASDLSDIESEIYKITPLAKLFDAFIHILHVESPNSKKKIKETIKDDLIKKYSKISFHLAQNTDTLDAINQYVADIQADMLAMRTHEIGFFEGFLKTHLSREEAFHSLVPLFTFKK